MVIAPKTALVRWMSHFIAADLPRWRTHLRTATLGLVLLALALTGLSPVRAAEPLREEGDTGLFQRVLTLPDAILRQSPRPDSGILQDDLPIFTIYYVYDRVSTESGTGWVEVGTDPNGDVAGWIQRDFLQDWKTMLVMQYAPRGQRERVLFFRERDDLADLVQSPFVTADVMDHYSAISEGTHDRARFAAIETAKAVDYRNEPYLMPIIGWKRDAFDNGADVTLLHVASVNVQESQPNEEPEFDELEEQQPELAEFKLGIVFVIDTTSSMQPYIERTYETVRGIYGALEENGHLDRVNFGLVAYRDSIEHDERLEYVTRVYQPLDPKSPPDEILRNIEHVTAAEVSTLDFYEDAYAGLSEALALDWSSYDARLIILITDAGAREGTDRRASQQGVIAGSVQREARLKNVAIIPIHLLTSSGEKASDQIRAEGQYRTFSETGDINVDKYLALDAESPDKFNEQITAFANDLQSAVGKIASGKLEDPDKAAEEDAGAEDQGNEGQTDLGDIVMNELFRSQVEYLGARAGETAPRFYRAWAAQLDLADPSRKALEVRVFLTRNELSTLSQALEAILNSMEESQPDPDTFFDRLRSLAANMSVDPSRSGSDEFDNLAESGLLPGYLKALPYKSKILSMTKDTWIQMQASEQEDLIDDMFFKLLEYEGLYEDQDNWKDLGSGDPALAAYPVPIEFLP
jgi:serine/threonine-protein kinase PpkA